MSVKELNFYWPMFDKALVVAKLEDAGFKLLLKHGITGEEVFELDRNQADMLRLYLTEHLK